MANNQPKVIHSKQELKALKSLDSENTKVVSSTKARETETANNEKALKEFEKTLKTKDIKDPLKLREFKRGKK